MARKVADIKKVDITVNEIPLEVLEVLKKLQENTSQKIDAPPDA